MKLLLLVKLDFELYGGTPTVFNEVVAIDVAAITKDVIAAAIKPSIEEWADEDTNIDEAIAEAVRQMTETDDYTETTAWYQKDDSDERMYQLQIVHC